MPYDPIVPKVVAATLMLLIAGCTAAVRPTASIVGPVWVATDIAGAAAGSAAPITLQLGTDGRASGRGGCNGYGGSYTLAGDALGFGPLMSTKMACAPAVMKQEQRYFEMLEQVARYAVADDGALLLTTADGRTLRFRQE